MSKNTMTIKFNKFQPSMVNFTDLEENKRSKGQKIAYVRYASVYTNFKEVGQFGEYIEELDGKSSKLISRIS